MIENKPAVVMSKTFYDKRNYPKFVLNVIELTEHYASIELLEVTAWEGAGTRTPLTLEPYLEALIKWDGCSHIRFGDLVAGKRDGYLHLCGASSWKQHCQVMEHTYREVSKLIKAFVDSELWDAKSEMQ